MIVNRTRISTKSEEETEKLLQHLSINQPVLTVNRNKRKRRKNSANDEQETYTQKHLSNMFPHDFMLEQAGKLQNLSINQPVLIINRNKKRRRISAKDEESKTQTQQHLSTMFPHDIMLDILSRLPVKTLMRFRSVSRSWNYLIRKDQFFINMHLSRSKLQPADHEKIILVDVIRNYCLYSLDYNQGSNRLERLIRYNSRHVRTKDNFIWGTCNGLVCTGGSPDDLYIWNPSTTEYRKIPGFEGHMQNSVYGFGYNSNAYDYVLVELTRIYDLNDCCRRFLSGVAIYSLRNNSWRSIGNIPYEVIFRQSGELVNGSLHWVAHSKFISKHFLTHGVAKSRFDEKETVLLAFEIASEKFLEMPCPDCNYDLEIGNVIVSQYQGKLCVFNDKHLEVNCDLWVMNDYGVRESWIKAFSFQKYVPNCCPPDIVQILICCTKEGSILMRHVSNGSACSYDPKHKTRRRILGIKSWGEAKSSYLPSIVALSFD